MLIEHAILETLEEIEEWEYQTRTGFTREEASDLLKAVKSSSGGLEITLDRENLSLLSNAFNEILNGFHHWKVHPYTPERVKAAEALFGKIRSMIRRFDGETALPPSNGRGRFFENLE
jgi:hypothetical protein